MTDPTPTRADVLREFYPCATPCRGCSETVCEREGRQPYPPAMADEIVRLRGQRDAMIRRVEALPRYFPENEFDGVVMAMHFNGYWLRRVAVLAALREGGDDGR